MSNTSIAQESPIEEIVVTGEKIERSLQDTASSVAVFTSSDIEESAIYDIQDVFDRLANVNSAEAGTGFTIRGINDNAVGASGTSSLASFHLDGAFIGRRGVQAGQTELWDIGQVEVFRGPQSTNQGRNSLAGAIFIRSNDPTYEPEGQYRIAYGSDNTRALSFAYSEALIEDQLAFRIAIDDQATDGFITNELLDDDEYGDSSNTTVRAKLLIEPKAIPGLSVLTTLSFSENEAGDTFSSLIDEEGNAIDPFDNRVFANIEAFDNVDQTIATAEVNYEINDQWSLTSITSYNDTDFFRQDDDDRQASGGVATIAREETTETISQEFRLNYDSERLRGNAGFYYFDQDTNEDIADLRVIENIQSSITASGGGAFASFYDDTQILDRNGFSDQAIENYAFFANIEYDVNNLITVFAGARYDSEEVNNTESTSITSTSTLPTPEDVLIAFGLPTSPTTPSAAINGQITAITDGVNDVNGLINSSQSLANDADFSAFLPKAGITFNWTDDLSTSFTVQRAYRAGGAGTTITPAELGGTGNFEFDPEFTTNYDFSLRSQWFDNRLTVNANLFYVEWEDQQVAIADTAGAPDDQITVNAAESTLKGAELEVSFRPTDSLELYTNWGYVDTEFDDFPQTTSEFDLSGNEFNDAPKTTASAGFSYDVLSNLRVQADVNYQDESFDDAENESENDSRTVVNSKVTYQVSEALEVSVVARNLFDKEYLVRNDEFDNDVVIVGQPRTVLLQLQGKF